MRAEEIVSLARGEGPLRAEHHRDDALVFGRIEAGRAQALGLAERHLLPVKRCLDADVVHLERKPEARRGEPVLDQAYNPEIEAWIAPATARQDDVLGYSTTAAAEQAVVDDVVVIADLGVGPPQRGREIGQPEVLVARARRPGRGQLELTTVDEDSVREHAQRNLVVGPEQTWACEIRAAG